MKITDQVIEKHGLKLEEYSNIKINTLASIFPSENPKYAIIIVSECFICFHF